MASVRIFETNQQHQLAAAAPFFQLGARHYGLYAFEQPLMNGKLRRKQMDFPLDRGTFRRSGPLFERVIGKARGSRESSRLGGAQTSGGGEKEGKRRNCFRPHQDLDYSGKQGRR